MSRPKKAIQYYLFEEKVGEVQTLPLSQFMVEIILDKTRASRHFWCRGYYVDTVGKNKKAIEEYIRNQLMEDEMMDQMTIKEYIDPFTGSKNSKA